MHSKGVGHGDVNQNAENVFVFTRHLDHSESAEQPLPEFDLKVADLGSSIGPGDPGYDRVRQTMYDDIVGLIEAFQHVVIHLPSSDDYRTLQDEQGVEAVHLRLLTGTNDVGILRKGFSYLCADFLLDMGSRLRYKNFGDRGPFHYLLNHPFNLQYSLTKKTSFKKRDKARFKSEFDDINKAVQEEQNVEENDHMNITKLIDVCVSYAE